MTNERRNDVELKVIAERVENLKQQLDRSDEISDHWRGRFCEKLDATNLKLDALIQKVDSLPCPMRNERTMSIIRDVGWLQKITYTALTIIIPSLIAVGTAWGTLSNEVDHIKDQVKWKIGYSVSTISQTS